ncbi:hypothetical protein BC833DRAFT_612374, partial [Globomyces pollinis-pini]
MCVAQNLLDVVAKRIGCTVWPSDPKWFQNGRIDMFVGENLLLDTSQNWLCRAVNRIYTSMRVKVENATDGREELYISSGIAHNATNPTVLQSIAYFLSLADGARLESPP